MDAGTVMDIGRQAVQVTLMMSAPLFLAALITGLVVSIFQAATQINEMTLSFVPKLIAIFITAVAAGPWMITLIMDLATRLISGIPTTIG
ncbi:flagellar biosynthesis protein FliQ [Pseudazoarcus pumilus]|uniref:Flagellar biosynthetic protein FliQ n=1 Tax=Pseudazoarcus pumilus TaxID=2067960 RepID=A0A2I6S8F8_9RHOO|nr:flagellar biosynthesis protein FliQ [Pseudazoarcus pumilus]AUN95543.1 flagellar biosynthetic protein FliQ [Pseudazoarcus pumilus]